MSKPPAPFDVAPAAAMKSSPRLAILVMCAGVASLVVSDTAAKLLLTGAGYTPLQILFVRSWLAAPLALALVLRFDGARALATPHLALHAVRGVLYVGAVAAFYGSLHDLSLAAATSLIFAAPLFVAAIAAVFLRERVPGRHWAAILLGFAGVLIIVQPGAEAFRPASLLAVTAAAVYALMMVSARWITAHDGFRTMTFYLTVIPGVLCSFVLLADWPAMQPGDAWLFAAAGVFGTMGVSLISQAFRVGPAAVVAPFDYTALVWASLAGWLVWGTVPGGFVYAGAALIAASGLYLIFRGAAAAPRED